MNKYIGIDLGTSGVKGLLVDSKGIILKEASRSYPCYYPENGYSEQNPSDWLSASIEVIKQLSEGQSDIKGMSIAGQMHGLVVLDKDDNVIRPAILWNDGRSVNETSYLNEIIGKEKISKYTGNIAFAGFMAPKILWLYNNEKENFDKIHKIMLPKDYLIYKLTGIFATDVSDASGMLLLDVKNRKYSKEMLEICQIQKEMLPKLFESFEVVGTLTKEYQNLLNLKDIKVVAGAADNAGAAIGTGTIGTGACNISLGTSGTIFLSSDNFVLDKNNALHSFCDSSGHYTLMGCILSAASCRSWWLEDILDIKDYEKDENELEESDVIFLPYLMGERSPHNDSKIRGAFINLSLNTSKGKMSQAILEGVTFAIKDCLEVAKNNGVNPTYSTLCGGGAKSKKWKQMVADVLDIPIKVLETNQGPSYGAAILAMVANKEYNDLKAATNSIIKVKEIYYPNKEKQGYYSKKYLKFKKLYPLLKQIEKED